METEESNQYKITFTEIRNRAQLERETHPSITQTANHMIAATYLEENIGTLELARDALMHEDPRILIKECLQDLVKKIQNSDSSRRYIWVDRLYHLGIRGLGLKIDDLEFIGTRSKNIFRAEPKWDNIEKHIGDVVLGKHFIEKKSIPSDSKLWGTQFPLTISSCDASQHRFKITLPFSNKSFATPIVINNAAGIIKQKELSNLSSLPIWKPIFVPASTREFEDWVVVGFDDYRDLSDDDYDWATKSAMDIGQYYVEDNYIFTNRGSLKNPDVHFRDGTIFPQDRAMNCTLLNRHGKLTMEAIFRMSHTLEKAQQLGTIFCGVAKTVHVTIYSIIIDYFIKEIMNDEKWNTTNTLIADSDMMRYVLYNKNFDAGTFNEIYVTCPIVRSYYVKSNFNNRTLKQFENDLKSLEQVDHTRTLNARQIVEVALDTKVAMFFAGHSNSDENYIPRYEFAYDGNKSQVDESVTKILSAIRFATLVTDKDHLFAIDEEEDQMATPSPSILVPVPIMLAHDNSKTLGKQLVDSWRSRVWAEYIKIKNKI